MTKKNGAICFLCVFRNIVVKCDEDKIELRRAI